MATRTDFHDLSHDELVRLLRLTFDGETFEEAAISVLEGASGQRSDAQYSLVCRCADHLDATRWSLSVEAGIIDDLLARLENSAVPALPARAAGGEGSRTTELVFAGGARSVAYSWWGETPPGYEPLADFALQLERIAGLRSMRHRRPGSRE